MLPRPIQRRPSVYIFLRVDGRVPVLDQPLDVQFPVVCGVMQRRLAAQMILRVDVRVRPLNQPLEDVQSSTDCGDWQHRPSSQILRVDLGTLSQQPFHILEVAVVRYSHELFIVAFDFRMIGVFEGRMGVRGSDWYVIGGIG